MTVRNDDITQKSRDYRRRSEKTQQELADMLGKTSGSISDLERGKVQISTTDLSHIVDLLNITPNVFIDSTLEDEDIQKLIYTIQGQPKDASINSFTTVKLSLEIQALSKIK